MVVDCGGGTVDITVYEMTTDSGKLKELYMATGGPHGSSGMYYSLINTNVRNVMGRMCATVVAVHVIAIGLCRTNKSIKIS